MGSYATARTNLIHEHQRAIDALDEITDLTEEQYYTAANKMLDKEFRRLFLAFKPHKRRGFLFHYM